ncbi:MAG: hypothetical protein II705_03910 [Clostridia bacterium]|nr:hypothetical protein [Clostridia bacterium]MBQ1435420.1 hypothetical protein [Clostridia bacterium]MBQ4249173.1 hypothetical protein [Clostridia bacterium]
MTLLITVFAAVISTAIWYKNAPEDKMKVNILCFIYWGASIMWLVDALFEYASLRAEIFTPAPEEMLNDLFLGLCVTALGLVIWIAALLIKDPRGVLRAALMKNKD